MSELKRIVVKVGTHVLTGDDGGIATARLDAIVEDCIDLKNQGYELIIVSSGAIGLGAPRLGLSKQLELAEKQASAAVGQALLMRAYRERFDRAQIVVAQVLLTNLDLSHRERYLNTQATLNKLLELGAVPIINENDSVSIAEISSANGEAFGDNDQLSALVAAKIGADQLIVLTNVDGFYEDNPSENPEARRISSIRDFSEISKITIGQSSSKGRGGIKTKIECSRVASLCGASVVIASGMIPSPIKRVIDSGEDESVDRAGTIIFPRSSIKGRKKWIGFSGKVEGQITINDGAKTALITKGASLLSVGIISVSGQFDRKSIVSVIDTKGHEIARGECGFSSEELSRIQGLSSEAIQNKLKDSNAGEVIHRNQMVLFEEAEL